MVNQFWHRILQMMVNTYSLFIVILIDSLFPQILHPILALQIFEAPRSGRCPEAAPKRSPGTVVQRTGNSHGLLATKPWILVGSGIWKAKIDQN